MTIGEIAGTLWKRGLLFVALIVLFMGAVAMITLSLPKTYRATATLYVGTTKDVNEALAYDTNIGEQLTRTYTALSANPNVADAVLRKLPFSLTRTELLDVMGFAPVERTQLLDISAEQSTPARAKQLADAYAQVFVERVNEDYARGTTPTRIAVAEPASVPDKPAKPNKPLYLGFGLVIATFLSLGIVLLRERLDTSIRVAPEDTEVLGQPIVGRIPMLSRRRTEASTEVADAFRLLRTNMTFLAMTRPRVVAVTSGSPSEGKSTICANLATTAAADGERVVVIEADLRRPGLRETLIGEGFEPGRGGLSTYLVGAIDEDEVVVDHPRIPGISVVWAGPPPPNPAGLLGSSRLQQLVSHLREEYDRVVIDTSPISVGADATLLLQLTDGTLFVIDARNTKATSALAGLNQLQTANVHVLGVVLNRMASDAMTTYGYYGERPVAKARG